MIASGVSIRNCISHFSTNWAAIEHSHSRGEWCHFPLKQSFSLTDHSRTQEAEVPSCHQQTSLRLYGSQPNCSPAVTSIKLEMCAGGLVTILTNIYLHYHCHFKWDTFYHISWTLRLSLSLLNITSQENVSGILKWPFLSLPFCFQAQKEQALAKSACVCKWREEHDRGKFSWIRNFSPPVSTQTKQESDTSLIRTPLLSVFSYFNSIQLVSLGAHLLFAAKAICQKKPLLLWSKNSLIVCFSMYCTICHVLGSVLP